MIMADIFAVFGTLLTLGLALPGLLLTWHLLLPRVLVRTSQRLGQSPWQCFFAGSIFLVIYLIPIGVLFNLPWGGFAALGAFGLVLLLVLASLGAAGLADMMGQRLQGLGLTSSTAGAIIRGSIAIELTAVFPVIGWFFFIPVTFIISLGAAIFGLLGWGSYLRTRSVTIPKAEEQPGLA